MKLIKRTILIIIILTVAGLLFRGWLYRHWVVYKSIGQRREYLVTDKKLVAYIEANAGDKKVSDIEDVIKLGLSITSKHLNFTAGKNDNDPNKLINSKSAHCVGYAAFFTSTCNYLIKKHHLDGYWRANAQAGQLFFFGANVHSYFNSPFFEDHDFVTIENGKTGGLFAVDPTVNDYFNIDFITYEK